jgi:hypothetical protein
MRGTLVTKLEVQPKSIIWLGKSIAIKEAWFEEAAELQHILIWFLYYKKLGFQYVCFQTDDPEAASDYFGPHYYPKGEHAGFSSDLDGRHWNRIHENCSYPLFVDVVRHSDTGPQVVGQFVLEPGD